MGECGVVIEVVAAGAVGLGEERRQSALSEAVDQVADLGEPVHETSQLVHQLQLHAGVVIVQDLDDGAHPDEAVAAVPAEEDGGAEGIGEIGVELRDVQLVHAGADDADGTFDGRGVDGVPGHDGGRALRPGVIAAGGIVDETRVQRAGSAARGQHARRDFLQREAGRERNEHAVDVHQTVQLERVFVVENREVDFHAVHVPQHAPPCLPQRLVRIARAAARVDVAREETHVGGIERRTDGARQLLPDRPVGGQDKIKVAHAQGAAGEEMVEQRRCASAADGQFRQAEPIA